MLNIFVQVCNCMETFLLYESSSLGISHNFTHRSQVSLLVLGG